MPQANSPVAQVDQAVDLLDQFSALLEQETVAVEGYRTDDFLALQDRKKLLAQLYAERVAVLGNPEGERAPLDPASVARLREAHGRFEVKVAANLRALASAGEAARRTVGTVVDLARSALADHDAGYGPRANRAAAPSAPASISVNVTL